MEDDDAENDVDEYLTRTLVGGVAHDALRQSRIRPKKVVKMAERAQVDTGEVNSAAMATVTAPKHLPLPPPLARYRYRMDVTTAAVLPFYSLLLRTTTTAAAATTTATAATET